MPRLLWLAAVLMLPPRVLAEPPGMFRGDLAHTGVYPGRGASKLETLKWQFHTAGEIYSSPVLDSGVLYVGSSDHHLYALDAASGQLKWKFKTGSRVHSTPAVENGVVYFLSYDSSLYAVEAATGQQKWKFSTAGEHRYTAAHLHGAEPAAEAMPDPFDLYLSSPSVWNGTVYFGSGDGNVYAVEAGTGALKWKFHTGDVVHSSPAIAGGTVFIGSWDSYFYALDAATGKEKWRFKTGEDPKIHNQQGIQASAAVADGTVYFGCRDSNFYAVDAATGKQKWVFPNKGSWVIGSAAVSDGKVYFATSDSGLLHALDAKTGAEVFSLDFKHWPMFSSPAISGSTMYIGSHVGKLYAIDLNSHQISAAFETEASRANAGKYVKADGTPNYENAFFDFFYSDMVVGVSKMFSMGPILASPAISNGAIYIAGADGNVYAIE
jgi:eukaryotic-like serine/threonine-protein kinase